MDVGPDHPEHGGGIRDPGPWAGRHEPQGHLAALEEGRARSGVGAGPSRAAAGVELGPEAQAPRQEGPPTRIGL